LPLRPAKQKRQLKNTQPLRGNINANVNLGFKLISFSLKERCFLLSALSAESKENNKPLRPLRLEQSGRWIEFLLRQTRC